MNSNIYSYETALGNVPNASVVNKFGFNADVDTASAEIVASFGGAYDPGTDVMSVAQTFTITYNNATDGLGTTGALSLFFTYLDENFIETTGFHTLGNTGSDVTSFSGVGINRLVVLSSGSANTNTNDITITATTDATNQAQIPALSSVTQQLIYHTEIKKTLLLDYVFVNVLKISGGSSPRVTIRGYSWSRVTETSYEIFDFDIDTSVNNQLQLKLNQPISLTGREVLYFTAETNTNNTKVSMRFGGVVQQTQ